MRNKRHPYKTKAEKLIDGILPIIRKYETLSGERTNLCLQTRIIRQIAEVSEEINLEDLEAILRRNESLQKAKYSIPDLSPGLRNFYSALLNRAICPKDIPGSQSCGIPSELSSA